MLTGSGGQGLSGLRIAKVGEVKLRIPKLRAQTFEAAVIELPAARELGREGLDRDVSGRGSVRGVEDITEALWGHAGVAVDGAGA